MSKRLIFGAICYYVALNMLGERYVEVQARARNTREFVCGGAAGNAKVIAPKGANSLEEMRDILVVQHGLPGVLWRSGMESKCGQHVGQNPFSSAVFPIPSGIKPTAEALNLANDSDLDECKGVLTAQPFTLEQYVENLLSLIKDVRGKIDKTCRLHLAGHSYGSASLLWALLQMRKEKLPRPASCSFLAPFVKIDLSGLNPGIALNIVNTRLLASRPLSHDAQVSRLEREVVYGCRRSYEFQPDSFLDSHRYLFNQAFFAALAGLEGLTAVTDVKVFRGTMDEYIGDEHVNLLRHVFGRAIDDCLFDLDDHNLESIQPADLFRISSF